MAEEEEEVVIEHTWDGHKTNDHIPFGEGTMIYPTGDKYVGNLDFDGTRKGKGVYTFANGASYDGEYLKNLKEGNGKFTYPDQSVYEGGWKEDLRSGQGTYTFPNGDTYKGGWEADKKHGDGEYQFKEAGSKFSGTWAEGSITEGLWTMKDGSSFKGTFAEGKPAEGAFTFIKTGNVLTGKFVEAGHFDGAPPA
mmetsp:Transcript_40423/g.49035  ORF Transcript_40423/g.49035 Transcript_40423/m.49035 type:complete len:194 (+) Transcript_40423:76-657(+)|eukprot:CAMPEP_0197849486 /NCGR_PEP_ID=MMETSP1438-20131217/12307_1 /TAXON_ID=1461541 /ORGANISM="Pterosperma sp., Strain CCMP1384" /LENGTH=193 /DNA_ID=CAMNT_0043462203 /DNA_START=59 /DNA_END=640 /DNA_ORIENTATION=+